MIRFIMVAFVVGFTVTSAFASDCPEYPDDMKNLIIAEFKREALVRDAGMWQEQCDLELVLVVNAATTKDYARDLGDRFVRMTKALGSGPAPGAQIGKGVYNYLVGAFTSTEKRLALGAKAASARRITW